MSEFARFIEEHRLSTVQIVRKSHRLEALTPEDETLLARRAELRAQGKHDYRADGVDKPRSGRGVTSQQVAAASAGTPVRPVVRAKLVRVLAVLTGIETKEVVNRLAI